MQDVPEENKEVEEVVTAEVTETVEEAAVVEEPTIEIGDRSFKTEAEALAYAREQMIVESAKADAFRQGVELASKTVTPNQNVTQSAPTPEDNTAWEQEFYADPKTAIAKAMAKAALEGEQRALSKVTAQSEDIRLWNKFSELNPDLADFKEDVEITANKHKEIVVTLTQTKGEDEAMKFIAQKARAKFKQYADKAKPGSALPNKGGTASPSGGAGKVTNSSDAKKSDKPLSFIEQIKQNKRRHA